jgi:Phosphotransferase enzyme family
MTATAQEIKSAYGAELDHDRPVTDLDQVPTSYRSITREWLTKAICRKVPGAEVHSFDLGERDDGSSNRRRISLVYNDAGREAKLPPTVFCKAAETLANRIVLGVSDTALAEANFYTKVRARLDIEAPHAWYARFDPNSFAYLIMMDDMADSVRFPDERIMLTRHQAEGMLRTLATLHARFYMSPELGTETLPFKRWPDWWADMMRGAPDFPDFCDNGFVGAESVMAPRLYRRRGEIWAATEKSVARHKDLPHTLIHSDVHLKNWYITRDDRMGLADWQLVTIGHWSRDFVFATTTALTVDQRREWHRDLLAYYLEQMAEHGVPRTSFDAAFLNIRQQLFTALAFWTITLCPTGDMPSMQPQRTAYEFLRRLLAAIDDYDALDA